MTSIHNWTFIKKKRCWTRHPSPNIYTSVTVTNLALAISDSVAPFHNINPRRAVITHEIQRGHSDGLVQDCSNSSALAMELLQSCTKPLILCSAIAMESLQSCTKPLILCTMFFEQWKYTKKYKQHTRCVHLSVLWVGFKSIALSLLV